MTDRIQTAVPAFPPTITTQPAGGNKALGDRVTFSVNAFGNRPFNFQWQKEGQPIPGATGSSLTLSDLKVSDSGRYSVVISNAVGAATSSNAELTVAPDPAPKVSNGIVSYWPFNVATTNTPDLYSRNDMALNRMDEGNLVPGKFGNALAFDGVEEFTTRVGGFPIYNNPVYSVALWVKGEGIGQTNRQAFAESSITDNTPLFIIGVDNTGVSQKANVFIRNNTGGGSPVNNLKSTRIAFDDSWHHLAWVDSNGQAKLYIDGVLDETDYTYTRGTLSLNTTAVGAIVRARPGNFFNGAVDEVAVWNRALTFTEIQEVISQGIKPPVTATPPAITLQPAGRDLLTGDSIVLLVEATGTSPLSFQWQKDGQAIAGATNNTLDLRKVRLSDAGIYTVVIQNQAGTATSNPTEVKVAARPAPPSQLGVDFNNRGAETEAETETGFVSFALSGAGIITGPTTRLFGGVEVTLSGSGGIGVDSRLRATPTNNLDFTQAKLLHDFVFSRENAGNQGLDIRIRYLAPDQYYTVTIWSFDTGSAGNRVSDWSANGLLIKEGYAFGGQNLPVSNNDYRFSFLVQADVEGTILIEGRRRNDSVDAAKAASFGVFINALQLEASEPPPPLLRITNIETLAGANLRLSVETANPTWEHRVQETSNLGSPSWNDVPGVTFAGPTGNTLQAQFAIPGIPPRFYRVVALAPPPLFADDFEAGAQIWTHGGIGDSWERGMPTTGPRSTHSGTNCWATGLHTTYELNTVQWLRSPVINLTQATAAELQFWEFRDVEPLFAGAVVDFTVVNIKDAADPEGLPLVQLAKDVGTQSQWGRRAFTLGSEVLGKSVILEFVLTTDDFQAVPQDGWYIDDVSIMRK